VPGWVRVPNEAPTAATETAPGAGTEAGGTGTTADEPLTVRGKDDSERTGWLRKARGSGRARVAVLTATLTAVALLGYLALLVDVQSARGVLVIPWPVFAVGFFLAEFKVVEVYFRRERHSFSLSDVPAVLGLFYLSPSQYLVALVVGSGLALIVATDQSPLKIVFNIANNLFIGVVTLVIFNALAGPATIPDASDWIAILVALVVASAVGAVTIATAITLSGGAPQFEKLPEMVRFGALVAAANTSLALLALTAAARDRQAIVLIAIPIVILLAAYRTYLSEREKHERLELVYESSRIMQDSAELDSAVLGVLRHAREMFRAERAEVLLFGTPGGGDALRTSCGVDGSSELMTPLVVDVENPELHRLTQGKRAQFVDGGKPGVRQAIASPMLADRGLIGVMRIENRLAEGSLFTDEDLRLLETLANQAAIALENGHLEQSLAELARLRDQLGYQATHDPLTGLANRVLFGDAVEERLSRGETPTVLFLDLDDFKMVNDSQGHAAGDRLLVAVADRIRGVLTAADVASRLGGDEFGILLSGPVDRDRAAHVARRIVDVLQLPFSVRGQDVAIGASVGIAFGNSGARAGDLLRDADVAMYAAKAAGKRQVAVFDPAMHAALVARHRLGTDLARAIADHQIEVHYQPVVSLADGTVIGVEALARWRHPERGDIGPTEFVRIAEEDGSVVELGRNVLAEASRVVAAWQRDIPGFEDMRVHVNVSARQVREPDFLADIDRAMSASGIRPGTLVVEMTETAMLLDTAATLEVFAALKSRGIRISVDDFGTGYSSLGYLRRFPVDSLKIAAEFVPDKDSLDEPRNWLAANTIVVLGAAMSLEVIAEGIELPEQAERLRALGCPQGQGYLFARPGDAAATERLLRGVAELPEASAA
jgi:diguanylate cyclase (GGDEF)-like protein